MSTKESHPSCLNCKKSGCKCTSYAATDDTSNECEACHHHLNEHNASNGPIVKKIYKQMFDLDEVRPYHDEAVTRAVHGESIVLILPTGHGKSYCTWAPALVSDGLAVVVEPLLARITDQLTRLNENYLKKMGCSAVAITGEGQKFPGKYDMKEDELFKQLTDKRTDKRPIKFIYMTAEKLSSWIATKKFAQLVKITKVNRVIFDEAFVMSQWSEFRPEHYQTLKAITANYPTIPYTLATACLSPPTLASLLGTLKLNPRVITGDLTRPNLFIEVRTRYFNKKEEQIKSGPNNGTLSQETDKAVDPAEKSNLTQLVNLIEKYKDDFGILYCNSRKQCDKLHAQLVKRGVKHVDKYYGSSNQSSRTSIENSETLLKWSNNEVKCMIATSAFGMGINKANVRYVVHWFMPDSFVSYYQQIGRAGRDGKRSECILYYHYVQKATLQKIKRGSGTSEHDIRLMVRYCRNNYTCRHAQLMTNLGQARVQPCGKMCDVCCRHNGIPAVTVADRSEFAKDICQLVWQINSTPNARITLSVLDSYLRKKYNKLPDGFPDPLVKRVLKLRDKYLSLRRQLHSLLVELVVRGYLRDVVTESTTRNITAYLQVDEEPKPGAVYDFLVPEPIPEVPPIYPPPETPKRRGLKRKREFSDEFWQEKKISIEQVSDDEEYDNFTKEEWKVVKFTDRHNDFATPYLEVEWQTGETTWEPEPEIRKNCSKLYWKFRAPLEKQGKWLPEPKIFETDYYAS